jgi:hypothetical protein
VTSKLRLLAFGGGVLAMGCDARLSGSFAGEAVESGTVKLTNKLGETSTNETLPRVLPDQQLSIAQSKGHLVVRFGSCELEGNKTSGETALVKGDCPVRIAGHEGTLPLSAMVTREGRSLRAEVAGVAENPNTVVSYRYMFKGERK